MMSPALRQQRVFRASIRYLGKRYGDRRIVALGYRDGALRARLRCDCGEMTDQHLAEFLWRARKSKGSGCPSCAGARGMESRTRLTNQQALILLGRGE